MRLTLAWASLRRHPARTALAILGVAVAAAMLLDMVMLSGGMRESFRQLLVARGFQLRVAPRGTLPFDTEATITGNDALVRLIRGNELVEAVSPVLGATVHTPVGDGETTAVAFALGVDPAVQGDYELVEGGDIVRADALVANEDWLRAAGARLGDTVTIATGYNPQLRAFAGERRVVVSGRARFLYLASGQPAVALPLATLQGMAGAPDRASVLMVRVRDEARTEEVARWIEREAPRVTSISTREAIASVDQRLSYFRQLGVILGAVSLIVAFLLVTTLVTVSVNERVGEIAAMRAIGVSRGRIVQQILLESTAINVTGAAGGLVMGLVTARWLNAILSSFPGLPAAIDFFLFQPRAVWTALGLLVISGIAAGIYPAWRAASLPIARTLREEAVA